VVDGEADGAWWWPVVYGSDGNHCWLAEVVVDGDGGGWWVATVVVKGRWRQSMVVAGCS